MVTNANTHSFRTQSRVVQSTGRNAIVLERRIGSRSPTKRDLVIDSPAGKPQQTSETLLATRGTKPHSICRDPSFYADLGWCLVASE